MSSPSTTKKRRLHDGDSGAPVTGSSGRLADEGKRLRVLPRRTGHTPGRELSKPTSTDVICVDNSSSDSDAYYQPSSRAVKRNPHRSNTSTLADLTDSFDVTASDIPSSNDAASSTKEASMTSASHGTSTSGQRKVTSSKSGAAKIPPTQAKKVTSPIKQEPNKFLLGPSSRRVKPPSTTCPAATRMTSSIPGPNSLLKKILPQPPDVRAQSSRSKASLSSPSIPSSAAHDLPPRSSDASNVETDSPQHVGYSADEVGLESSTRRVLLPSTDRRPSPETSSPRTGATTASTHTPSVPSSREVPAFTVPPPPARKKAKTSTTTPASPPTLTPAAIPHTVNQRIERSVPNHSHSRPAGTAADETGPDVPSLPQGGATAAHPLRPGPRVPPSSKPVASSKTTKIKLVRPDCVRDGVPFFRWRDESIRRAPPSPWDFPHTFAQALWLFWFHGNGHVGPLVHLTSEDVAQCSKRGKMRWALAQRLIAVLVDAVDAAHTVAMGSLSIKSSVHLFETAFAKVLQPAGLEPKVFAKKTFVEVGEALSSALKAAGPPPPNSSISSASGRPPPRLEAASAATPTPATDGGGGRAMFVWTDGSNHRVPESWTFRDAPCHDVWMWWFKGSDNIRPYRELGNSDMPSEVEWSNLARCRLVMDTMEAVVEANGMTVEAVAKLPTPEFRLVFDSTLVQLLQLSRRPALDSVATRAGRLSFARLYYFLIAMEPPTEPTSAWCGWFFPWSDRSVRRTPEHAWTFPPNASVRQVWWWWFHGDPVNRMCPYRLFTDHDLWPRYVSQLADCRAVMNALFELAASCFGLVQDNMSSLPPAVFETAVHKACAILLHEHEALRHRFQSPVQVANAPVSVVSRVLYDSAALRPGWHRWQDGSVRRVPESWTLPPPTTSVVQMWTWWFHGDGDANLGPFRNLKPSDMPGKLTQERYAAVTYVMSTLEAIASGPLRLVPPGTDVADLPVWESLAVLHAMLKHSPTAHAKMPFTSVLVAMQQHVLGATLVVDSRGRPLHRWSDKSLRRAPEHWTFEDAPCRLMWLYWFLGNPDTYVGPFRKLTAQDLGPASVAASTAAAVVMEFVTAAAVQFNQLKDPTKAINMAKLNASKSLLKVFDNTVRVIGVGRLQGMADMRCTDVYAILQTSASTAQHVEPGSDPSRVDATAVTDGAMPSQKSPDVAAVAVAVEQQGELPPPKPSNDPSRHTMALQNPEAMAVDLSVLTCVTLWEWWFHGTPHNPETPTASRKPLRDKAATSSDDAAALAMSHAIVQEMELVAHDLGLLSERPADGVPAPSRQETRSVAVRAWDAFRLRLGGEVVEAATCLDVLVALTTHDPTASRRKVSRFFRWPTGMYRRTPPTWCFVPTTCWILWLHWFLGDDDAGIGPFRLLQPSDVEDPELLTMAKTTMDTLVRLTGTAVVQLADMDERALVALYEQASGKLYLQLPGDARANILNNRLQGLTVDRWNFDVVAALLRASSGTK